MVFIRWFLPNRTKTLFLVLHKSKSFSCSMFGCYNTAIQKKCDQRPHQITFNLYLLEEKKYGKFIGKTVHCL